MKDEQDAKRWRVFKLGLTDEKVFDLLDKYCSKSKTPKDLEDGIDKVILLLNK